ncbi:MAG: glycosyltransferase family 39 protein [Candidatus Omnitrophica bacterium]|nr:glycosyltransferase family 39 protein [Candidatus Omnitrophota bacterium]
MKTILFYLYQYVKFGPLTTYFLMAVSSILLGKYFLKFKWPFSSRTTFFMILVLGLALRIGWVFYSAHTPMSHWNAEHMLENDRINVHAIELVEKNRWFLEPDGRPSGRRPIGYPLFLAVFYKIFGVHIGVAWAVNLGLFSISLFFLYKLAEKIFGGSVALITVFLFSIYPMSIYSIKLLTDEHLFIPFWYGGLFLLFEILHDRKVRWDWIWLGLIFGYTAMIRTHAIFMPLVVGIAFWLLKRPWREIIGKIILVAIVMQVINLPWIVRNYIAWKVPILYIASGAGVYAQVNSTAKPEGNGHVPEKGDPGYSPELDQAIASGNEGLIHKISNREMKRWILEHPQEFWVMGVSRLLYFMNFNRQGGVWALWHQYYPGSFDPKRPLPPKLQKILEEYALAFYYIVFFSWLFAIGILISRWQTLTPLTKNCLLVLGSCFLFWFAEHIIIYPDRKYRFPLEPLMLITTAFFFYNLHTPKWITPLLAYLARLKKTKC